jgi:hypothetical protein
MHMTLMCKQCLFFFFKIAMCQPKGSKLLPFFSNDVQKIIGYILKKNWKL